MNPFDNVMKLVNKQAEDEGLWFVTKTAPEAYLQAELRKLHYSIEMADKESSHLSLDDVIEVIKRFDMLARTDEIIKALQQKFGE